MINLYNGEALDVMQLLIADNIKVDAIITDPPYGTTNNKWDSVINLDDMWGLLKQLIKDDGIIVLFSDGLFTSNLKLSNPKMWKYDLVWDKLLSTGFLNANRMPLRVHETISVFYDKSGTYIPQKVKGSPNHSKGKKKPVTNNNYGKFNFKESDTTDDMKHPKSIISIQKPHPSKSVHPTQKPVELMEWLINSYTNKNETVLDFTMGSGTTGVACVKLNRNFIGIELNNGYFDIANDRISSLTSLDDVVKW